MKQLENIFWKENEKDICKMNIKLEIINEDEYHFMIP